MGNNPSRSKSFSFLSRVKSVEDIEARHPHKKSFCIFKIGNDVELFYANNQLVSTLQYESFEEMKDSILPLLQDHLSVKTTELFNRLRALRLEQSINLYFDYVVSLQAKGSQSRFFRAQVEVRNTLFRKKSDGDSNGGFYVSAILSPINNPRKLFEITLPLRVVIRDGIQIFDTRGEFKSLNGKLFQLKFDNHGYSFDPATHALRRLTMQNRGERVRKENALEIVKDEERILLLQLDHTMDANLIQDLCMVKKRKKRNKGTFRAAAREKVGGIRFKVHFVMNKDMFIPGNIYLDLKGLIVTYLKDDKTTRVWSKGVSDFQIFLHPSNQNLLKIFVDGSEYIAYFEVPAMRTQFVSEYIRQYRSVLSGGFMNHRLTVLDFVAAEKNSLQSEPGMGLQFLVDLLDPMLHPYVFSAEVKMDFQCWCVIINERQFPLDEGFVIENYKRRTKVLKILAGKQSILFGFTTRIEVSAFRRYYDFFRKSYAEYQEYLKKEKEKDNALSRFRSLITANLEKIKEANKNDENEKVDLKADGVQSKSSYVLIRKPDAPRPMMRESKSKYSGSEFSSSFMGPSGSVSQEFDVSIFSFLGDKSTFKELDREPHLTKEFAVSLYFPRLKKFRSVILSLSRSVVRARIESSGREVFFFDGKFQLKFHKKRKKYFKIIEGDETKLIQCSSKQRARIEEFWKLINLNLKDRFRVTIFVSSQYFKRKDVVQVSLRTNEVEFEVLGGHKEKKMYVRYKNVVSISTHKTKDNYIKFDYKDKKKRQYIVFSFPDKIALRRFMISLHEKMQK